MTSRLTHDQVGRLVGVWKDMLYHRQKVMLQIGKGQLELLRPVAHRGLAYKVESIRIQLPFGSRETYRAPWRRTPIHLARRCSSLRPPLPIN